MHYINNNRKKILRLLSALLLLPLFCINITASAANDYSNTYKNTGNERNDIINVAITQIGYCEGDNNDTKYGAWYGLNNNPWCAMFISWCARQADIPACILPSYASCDMWIQWFKENNLWVDVNKTLGSNPDYTVLPGDLVFYDWEGDGTSGHVGLVEYVSDGEIHAIEGNTGDDPEHVLRKVRTDCILGYGTPKYLDTSACDMSLPADYTVSTGGIGLHLRSKAGTDNESLSSIPDGSIITISRIDNGWGKTSYNGYDGFVSMDYCIPAGAKPSDGSYVSTGSKEPASQNDSPSPDNSCFFMKAFEGFVKSHFCFTVRMFIHIFFI